MVSEDTHEEVKEFALNLQEHAVILFYQKIN